MAIGVRAAITGHLVLSTLHTNDCASTIHRLRNMGVPPYMAAASLSGIIAQRLVKLLCPNCRQPTSRTSGSKGYLRSGGGIFQTGCGGLRVSSLRGYGIYREDSGL